MKRELNIELVREYVATKRCRFYRHALTEALKDGVEPADIIHILLTGRVIEEYSERERLLVYGEMSNGLPLHAVCDFSNERTMYIATTYIPSQTEWIRFQIRKDKPRKKR